MRRLFAPRLANNLWKMQVIRLCLWTHFMAAVLVPFFRDWGGLSYTRIFFLNAWFMFWNFLLEVPTGSVADVFGRKASIALSALVGAAGWLLYTSLPDFRIFLIGEIFVAASMTLSSGADEALVYDTLVGLKRSEQAQRVFGRLESFKLAGIVLGALSGGFIAARWGLRAPMLLQAVPSMIGFAIALSLAEPTRERSARSLGAYAQTLRSGLTFLRQHATLRVLTADMVGSLAVAWLIIWLYQPQLERAGIAMPFFGVVHATMCVTQILLLSQLDRIERGLGSTTRYLLLSAVVPPLAYVGLACTSNPVAVIALIVISAAFGLSRPVVFTAYLNAHIPSAQRATILSTVSMARTLVVAILNPLAGYLVDRSMSFALVTFGAVGLLVAIATRVGESHLIAPQSATDTIAAP